MPQFTPNNRPLPDFLGIRWGASKAEARRILEAREGVTLNDAESGQTIQVFNGGLYANRDVKMWVLQFVDDKLHTAKILISPPPAQSIAEFRDLSAKLTREYGEPAQGGIIVSPPFGEGQELEAVAAGRGIAAALYVFGTDGEIEGSIKCQVAPDGQIVTNYQNERLNRLAISKQTGLDAPVSGMPTMQTQTAGGGACFIATATLRDPDHSILFVLRLYRDEVLLPRTIGKLFVSCYYALAPLCSYMIESSRHLRTRVYNCLVFPSFRHALNSLSANTDSEQR